MTAACTELVTVERADREILRRALLEQLEGAGIALSDAYKGILPALSDRARLHVVLWLLDDIGWTEHDTATTSALTLPAPRLRGFLGYLRDDLARALRETGGQDREQDDLDLDTIGVCNRLLGIAPGTSA